MVKHTQTIRQQHRTNCLSVFDHFVGLALKGLKKVEYEDITAACFCWLTYNAFYVIILIYFW